jgi:hypothetical protein
MQGATDGGKYVEAMRTRASLPCHCGLCGAFTERPEFHHEKYRPERGLFLCHACHHKAHFTPWHLSDAQKEKLLFYRHGAAAFSERRGRPDAWRAELKGYHAPGRHVPGPP